MKRNINHSNRSHLAAKIAAPILALALLAVPVQAFAAEEPPADTEHIVDVSISVDGSKYGGTSASIGVAGVTDNQPHVTQAAFDAALPAPQSTTTPATEPESTTPAPDPERITALNGEEARVEENQASLNYWEPEFAVMEQGTKNSTIALNCNNMDYVPAYILSAMSDTGDTLVMTHAGETYTIRKSDIGKLDPSLNYRFVDLYALGYAG